MMRAAQRHDLDVWKCESRAQRVAIVFAPDAERLGRQLFELRFHEHAAMRVAHPVGDMKFELDARTRREQRDQPNLRLQFMRQTRGHERQHIRAARVTDEHDARFVMFGRRCFDDRLQIFRSAFRSSLRPEILE